MADDFCRQRNLQFIKKDITQLDFLSVIKNHLVEMSAHVNDLLRASSCERVKLKVLKIFPGDRFIKRASHLTGSHKIDKSV